MKTLPSAILSIFILMAFWSEAFAQANVTVSQAEAIRHFPDLAKAGSKFHKAFLAKFQAAKAMHDPVLNRDDWPMILGVAVANELRVKTEDEVASDPHSTKPNPVLEKGTQNRNSLERSQNAKTGSSDGLPWPIEDHTFTIEELNQYREQISGKIVLVAFLSTSYAIEPVDGMYKVSVNDKTNPSAVIWFPNEGLVDLKAAAASWERSYFVKVENGRLTAVGRWRHTDALKNSSYAW